MARHGVYRKTRYATKRAAHATMTFAMVMIALALLVLHPVVGIIVLTAVWVWRSSTRPRRHMHTA